MGVGTFPMDDIGVVAVFSGEKQGVQLLPPAEDLEVSSEGDEGGTETPETRRLSRGGGLTWSIR